MLRKLLILCGIPLFVGLFSADLSAARNTSNARAANKSRGLTVPMLQSNTGIHQNITGNTPSGSSNIINNDDEEDDDPGDDPLENYDPELGLKGLEDCMAKLKSCISGAFPDGIADLYDPKIREAVFYGQEIERVAICQTTIDSCRINVKYPNGKLYFANDSDIWAEFTKRIIQPAYYSLVMGTTGMTPEQAENTCLLLDRNTYGKSYARTTGDADNPDGEYGKTINPFNNKGNQSDKENTRGVKVNNTDNRGYYARWDAKNGQCLVRVGAYRKDNLIYDNWGLSGGSDGSKSGIGTKKAAEIWVKTGDSFTCSQDAFEFALKNATKTVALWGGIGGTVVGTVTGIGIGATKDKDKSVTLEDINCSKKNDREILADSLEKLPESSNTFAKNRLEVNNFSSLTEAQCNQIKNLKSESWSESDWDGKSLLNQCKSANFTFGSSAATTPTVKQDNINVSHEQCSGNSCNRTGNPHTFIIDNITSGCREQVHSVVGPILEKCDKKDNQKKPTYSGFGSDSSSETKLVYKYSILGTNDCTGNKIKSAVEEKAKAVECQITTSQQSQATEVVESQKNSFCEKVIRSLLNKGVTGCTRDDALNECSIKDNTGDYYWAYDNFYEKTCLYKQDGESKSDQDSRIFCVDKTGTKSVSDSDKLKEFQEDLAADLETKTNKDKAANIGKGAAIGAASGIALAGIATGITAAVESKQINCRVGDDLERIAFKKSYTIPSLRDFYVKWALNLTPVDGPIDSKNVQTYAEWMSDCSLATQDECESKSVVVLSGNTIQNACTWTGSKCVVNDDKARASNMLPQGVSTMLEWRDFCSLLDVNTTCTTQTTFAQSTGKTLKCKITGPTANRQCTPDGTINNLR